MLEQLNNRYPGDSSDEEEGDCNPSATNILVCPHCHTVAKEHHKFCIHCGRHRIPGDKHDAAEMHLHKEIHHEEERTEQLHNEIYRMKVQLEMVDSAEEDQGDLLKKADDELQGANQALAKQSSEVKQAEQNMLKLRDEKAAMAASLRNTEERIASMKARLQELEADRDTPEQLSAEETYV